MFYTKLCKIKEVLILPNKKKILWEQNLQTLYIYIFIYNKFRNCCDLFWYSLDTRKNHIIENLGFSLQ